jgi:hypothetical protein
MSFKDSFNACRRFRIIRWSGKAAQESANHATDVQPSKCSHVVIGLLRRFALHFIDQAVNIHSGKFSGPDGSFHSCCGERCAKIRDPGLLGYGGCGGHHYHWLKDWNWDRCGGGNEVVENHRGNELHWRVGGPCGDHGLGNDELRQEYCWGGRCWLRLRHRHDEDRRRELEQCFC